MDSNSPVTNCLFEEPWWLDAVAPGAWDAVEVRVNGEVRARLPFILGRRYFFRSILQPPLTQTLGPWLKSGEGKNATRLAREKDLMFALIESLPEYDRFSQSFHYAITNWLPFSWKGFSQTTRYTYVLDDLSDLDAVWDGFQVNIRTDVRKAQRRLEVERGRPAANIMDTLAMTFTRQGMRTPYAPDLVERIEAACGPERCATFAAVDATRRIHACAFIVWDKRSAYYLLSGGDPELRNSGAQSLVLWEAIKFAATVTRKFDFEGSMLEPVERFFRAFGARLRPYFHVTFARRTARCAEAVKAALRAAKLWR
ncbi:MAG: GNAT family N-acetyltransferase [Desulfovibrio sp.]|jgi:hypothetical protein|nr:GNAT family N-acetyltransferase [Desulfovibrio sp.]